MSEGLPLFAYAFRGGVAQALHGFAEADALLGSSDFIWVHLDPRDLASQKWLRNRPWPPKVIDTVAAPIQRGKLFTAGDLIYGHLRDFRKQPSALQAGSLCIAASSSMIVTGRHIPLLSIEELQRRVEAQTILPGTPFALITEFFRALNDIGEGLLLRAGERLSALGSDVLKREGSTYREEILELRRGSIQIARDMAYKRAAMLELLSRRPTQFPADEFERFKSQVDRYIALCEDAQDYAEDCQFLLEEVRAQVEEQTNRNLYILTVFSAIFLPAELVVGLWGMNVAGIPFSSAPNGFWAVGALIVAVFALVVLILRRLKIF